MPVYRFSIFANAAHYKLGFDDAYCGATSEIHMSWLLLAILLVAVAWAALKYRRYTKRHAAAMNVVLAKYTFEQLSRDRQRGSTRGHMKSWHV